MLYQVSSTSCLVSVGARLAGGLVVVDDGGVSFSGLRLVDAAYGRFLDVMDGIPDFLGTMPNFTGTSAKKDCDPSCDSIPQYKLLPRQDSIVHLDRGTRE